MNLSEALMRRADAQKRIAQLRQRLARNARIQEGEQPYENPEDMLAEVRRTLDTLTTLIRQINHTNSVTIFDGDLTLTDALAQRDALMIEHSVLSGLVDEATRHTNRYSRSEIRYIVTVDVAEIQARMDQLAQDYRALDTRIQAVNWATELIES